LFLSLKTNPKTREAAMPKLKILGTAGYHPSETRQTVSAFLPEYGIVLDAGSGIFRLRGQIQTPSIDIFLSHMHLDHSIGITFLLDVLYGTNVKVRVWGIKEHLDALRTQLFGSPLFPLVFGSSVCPYETREIIPGNWVGLCKKDIDKDISFCTKELPHPGKSIGYRFRFRDGPVLAYVTDTTCRLEHADFVRGADLLLHECNFPDEIPGIGAGKDYAEGTSHSWTSGVADLANIAGVKQLVLTHFNPLDPSEDPSHQESAKVKHPNTVIAQDNMEIEF
jgi:ribonuclease BN (tRNA processing enzyme)